MARKYSKGSCSLFGHSMDSVDKRESEKIEGLNSSHCTGCLVKVIEFKKIYMVLAMLGQDQCLNSRSGTHGLNDADCGSVSHVLQDCPAHTSINCMSWEGSFATYILLASHLW